MREMTKRARIQLRINVLTWNASLLTCAKIFCSNVGFTFRGTKAAGAIRLHLTGTGKKFAIMAISGGGIEIRIIGNQR